MSIIQIYEDYDLQLVNLWDFYFTDFPNIKYRCQSVSTPFLTLETETRSTGTKHYTKATPEESFSATFLETTNFLTYAYFRSWMDSVYDQKERVFKSGTGKFKDAVVALQTTKETTNQFERNKKYEFLYTKAWKLNRCLITSISDLDLNYTTGDNLIFTIEFTVDYVEEMDVSEVDQGTILSEEL